MREVVDVVRRHAQGRIHQDRVADRLETARPVEMAVPVEVHRQRAHEAGNGARRADGQRRVGHAFEDHGQDVAADARQRVDERGPLRAVRTLKRAAEHFPRVDAIGASSAGCYSHNRVTWASLYRALLARVDHIELAGEPQYTQSTFVGGLKTLPIRYRMK